MTMKSKKKLLIIVAILVVISVILGELYYLKSRFHYEDHLDETVVTVDGTDITLRQFGYYIFVIEDFVQKQALLYDKEDPTHWWHTHFAAGLDSTFVSDYARKTAIDTCVCNEIYSREAIKLGFELNSVEEQSALEQEKEMYARMDLYQRAITGLDEGMILDYKRKEILATKYATYLAGTTDLSGYSEEPLKLVNWDGEYYLNVILPQHEIIQNDKLLKKITLGRITVNYDT